AQQALAAEVDRVTAALAKEEAAARAALAAQEQAARQAAFGGHARAELRSRVPNNAGDRATAREPAELDAATAKVARGIASGRVAFGDYESALAKVRAGTRDFTIEEGQAAILIRKVADAQAGLGRTAAEGATRAAQEMRRLAGEAEKTAAREVKADEAVRKAALDATEALKRRNDA